MKVNFKNKQVGNVGNFVYYSIPSSYEPICLNYVTHFRVFKY